MYSTSIFFFALLWIAGILFKIFKTVAVGYDCKALAVTNRALWMVLCFFSNIAVIIYLCMRQNGVKKDTLLYCNNCHSTMPPNATQCYKCGALGLTRYEVVDSKKNKHNAKVFGWLAIACICIGILSYCFGMSSIISSAIDDDNPINNFGNSHSYSENYNNDDDSSDSDDYGYDFFNYGNND